MRDSREHMSHLVRVDRAAMSHVNLQAGDSHASSQMYIRERETFELRADAREQSKEPVDAEQPTRGREGLEIRAMRENRGLEPRTQAVFK